MVINRSSKNTRDSRCLVAAPEEWWTSTEVWYDLGETSTEPKNLVLEPDREPQQKPHHAKERKVYY